MLMIEQSRLVEPSRSWCLELSILLRPFRIREPLFALWHRNFHWKEDLLPVIFIFPSTVLTITLSSRESDFGM